MNDPLTDVMCERARQDKKWGIQNHRPGKWLEILVEEVGEVAKAILEREPNNYRKEMVEVCAVALAALECFERRGVDFKSPEDHLSECLGCGNMFDPEVCWCGDLIRSHDIHCGHNPVPLGCECGRCQE